MPPRQSKLNPPRRLAKATEPQPLCLPKFLPGRPSKWIAQRASSGAPTRGLLIVGALRRSPISRIGCTPFWLAKARAFAQSARVGWIGSRLPLSLYFGTSSSDWRGLPKGCVWASTPRLRRGVPSQSKSRSATNKKPLSLGNPALDRVSSWTQRAPGSLLRIGYPWTSELCVSAQFGLGCGTIQGHVFNHCELVIAPLRHQITICQPFRDIVAALGCKVASQP